MRGFRPERLLGTALVAALGAAVLAGCSADTQPMAEGAGRPGPVGGDAPRAPEPVDQQLQVDAGRQSGGTVAAGGPGAPYNYGPTVMLDGGQTRMWWCSQYGGAPPPGDDILYGEAATADGPFTGQGGGAPRAVFSGSSGGFDAMHVCDPSVIRVDGTYYLYYTGAAGDHALGNSIGLATSTDGVNWSRANGGAPILNPAHDTHRANAYGAGQPAVVHLDGWFYLMFTDTTGAAAGWNGAGQFLVRAKDPAFATGVEALGDKGFIPVPNASAARSRSLVDAFSADLTWVAALNAFAIAHETQEGTTLTFWNRGFTANPYRPVVVPGPWQEGPGLVRQADGHAPISVSDPCGRVPLDLVRATVIGGANAPTDLRHFGIDVHGLNACGTAERALAVLDGFAMPSPVRTMDLVTGGKVIRVDRRSVAAALATRVLDRRLPALDWLPVAARLPAETRALRAPGPGVGLLLDDGRLWPVRPTGLAELNGSKVEPVTEQQWTTYPAGLPLGR
ncbi:beta-xylosidase [Amycolatopsis nigrescens]|uniref:beta-xylosidase n=1 Tax=Amycolatopsis nigrescens TaxID=381445 RepID=UPI001B7FA5DB|nr:beta-xylosidase [Amycolatopsis nigrescens]